MTSRRISEPEELIRRVVAGDRRATAKAISLVEDDRPGRTELLKGLYPNADSFVCGITGPPGAGKSTLVDQLVLQAREGGEQIGIICVDPSSPFTGGALLGDRIRMGDIALDPGVFIRSMATRGSRGGLAKAARAVTVVLGATGFDRIYLETVGVGQIELDIAETADTTVVVLVPESGDGIQVMKAGLMEIGDVFVINKADREGAEGLRVELESVLQLRKEASWRAPVLSTVASDGEGIDQLAEAIERHRSYLAESGEGAVRRRGRIRAQVRDIVLEEVSRHLWHENRYEELFEARLKDILDGRTDPFAVAEEILESSGLLAALEGDHA